MGRILKPSFSQTQRFGINRKHPLARGLVACFILNEGGGNSLVNLVGTSGIGILNASGNNWKTVDSNIALSLDKTSTEYLTAPMAGRQLTELSIVTRAKLGADGVICGRGTAGDVGSFYLQFVFGNRIRFIKDGVTEVQARSSSVLSTNTIYDLAVTWNGSATASEIGLYRDGEALTHDLDNNGATIRSDAGLDLTIGAHSDGGQPVTADIEYKFLYNRVLSISELNYLRHNPYDMVEPLYDFYNIGEDIAVVGGVLAPYYYTHLMAGGIR